MAYAVLGRRSYVEHIELLSAGLEHRQVDEPPVVLQLTAGAGGGKSTILDRARDVLARQAAFSGIHVVDLEPRGRRSRLAVLEEIARQAAACDEPLVRFSGALTAYDAERVETRPRVYREVLTAFHSEWRERTARKPAVVLLDSCEKHGDTTAVDAPLRVLSELGGRTLVVLATQRPLALAGHSGSEQLPVMQLTADEVIELSNLMAEDAPTAVRQPSAGALAVLQARCSGRPLLVRMALAVHFEGWLDLDDAQTAAFPDIGREVVLAIDANAPSAAETLRLLTVVVHRVDADLLEQISDLPRGQLETALATGVRLGVVRELDDGTLRLHEDFVDMLDRVAPAGASFRRQVVERAADAYRARAEAGGAGAGWADSVAEAMYYWSLSDAAAAGTATAALVTEALSNNDVEAARRIAQIAISDQARADLGNRVAGAMVANRAFEPAAALTALGELDDDEDQGRLELGALWHIARAEAITNPCTIVRADPNDAVPEFAAAAFNYKRLADDEGLARTLVSQGWVQTQLGKHDVGEMTLQRGIAAARKASAEDTLAAGLEYLGELYRLIQELDKAEAPLEEASRLRRAIDKPLTGGFGLFTMANLARDRWEFETADALYAEADEVFRQVNDFFRLQECLNDQSWLYFLDDDIPRAEALLEEQFDIVSRHSFGTGRSSYFHGVYELAIAAQDFDKAYVALDDGLAAVRQFPHTYMLVDLLHHDAQRGYRIGHRARVQACLEELEAIEANGCRVRVFRGRTMLLCGDMAADDGQWEDAASWWMEGLIIVALHGDSRTNVELFEDVVASRAARLRHVLADNATRRKWQRRWREEAGRTSAYAHLWNGGVLD